MLQAKSLRKTILICFGLIILTNIVATIARLFVGVDLTDEVMAFSMAKHFSHGFKFFLDESDLHQTYVVYALPIYELVKSFSPHLNNLILFSRLISYTFLCGLIFFVIRAFKERLPAWQIFALCLPLVSYTPYKNIGFHYLPLIYYFGVALAVLSQFNLIKNRSLYFLLIGLFSAMSFVTYPSFAPVLALFIFLILKEQKISRLKYFSILAFGLLIGLSPLIYYVHGAGWAESFSAFKEIGGNFYPQINLNNLERFGKLSHSLYFLLSSSVLGFIISISPLKKNRELLIFLFSLVASLCLFFGVDTHDARIELLLVLLGSFLFGLFLGDFSLLKKIKASFFLILFGFGACMAISSVFLGVLAFSWGLMVFTVIAVLILLLRSESQNKSYLLIATALTLNTFISATNLLHFYENYFDNPSTIVQDGPYSGILTVTKKIDYFKELKQLLQELTPKQTLFIYYNLPAGYLFTEATPLTNNVYLPYWFVQNTQENFAVTSYLEKNMPDFVLQVKYFESRVQTKYVLDISEENEIKMFFANHKYQKTNENSVGILYSKVASP